MNIQKRIGIVFFCTFLLLVGACGKNNKDTEGKDPSSDSLTNMTDQDGGSKNTGSGYGFTHFELDIEVDGKDAIEAKYEVEGKNVEVYYENKLNNILLTQNDAIDELHKMFTLLDLTKDTPKKEATDKILEWYQLDSFSSFDLEVTFDDGNVLNIEEKRSATSS